MKKLLLLALPLTLTSCTIASGFSGISAISLHSTQASHLSTKGELELFQKFEYYLSRQDKSIDNKATEP